MMSRVRSVGRILCVSILLLGGLAATAQESVSALDNAIRRLSAGEGLQADFEMKLEGETIPAHYYAEGRRFYYDSEPVKAWYNGTDLWVYIAQNGEVNLSTPEKEDLLEINPLLNLEELRTHHFGVREERVGESVRVTATPDSATTGSYRGTLRRLTAMITPEGRPLTLTIEEADLEQPIEILVTRFEEGAFPELRKRDFFAYTSAKVPGAVVIDLR